MTSTTDNFLCMTISGKINI